jgi:ABC-type transport system involved in multi-copper enzyme maturation permease subunit
MENNNNPNLSENLNEAIDDVKEYINLRMQLIQLNVTEKVSIGLAGLIAGGIALILFILCFIFGSFALSYLIGNWLNSTAAGFGVMAGFYFIVGIIMLKVGKGKLRVTLINSFIKQFSND